MKQMLCLFLVGAREYHLSTSGGSDNHQLCCLLWVVSLTMHMATIVDELLKHNVLGRDSMKLWTVVNGITLRAEKQYLTS